MLNLGSFLISLGVQLVRVSRTCTTRVAHSHSSMTDERWKINQVIKTTKEMVTDRGYTHIAMPDINYRPNSDDKNDMIFELIAYHTVRKVDNSPEKIIV